MNNPNVSWIGIIHHALPQFMRKQKLIRFLKSAYSGLIWLYDKFILFRAEVLFRLRYTGQVIYLEHMLNAKFNQGAPAYTDGLPTGIWIGPGSITFNPPYVFTKPEALTDNRFVYDKSETPVEPSDVIWLYTREELELLNFDFTVNVPDALGDVNTNTELFYAIRAWVNYYKQAGKTFIIQNYTP